MEKMAKALVLKKFFSAPNRPVENKELMELMNSDRAGYNELAALAAKALGVEIEVKAAA